MANPQAGEGPSSGDVSAESSESTLQLNIKTLDSRIFNFHIDKNIVVSAFKEKIACQLGIPVQQQRLIFRGKVLKDDHLLSEYNVENGDTLHVVERLPQPAPAPNTVPFVAGQDSASGGSHNRIGQIAHSVVLGTLNVGEQGEAAVPDLSRVIGAVLNSVGLGNLAGGIQPGVLASQGNGTEESRSNAGSQNQTGNQSFPSQAAIAIPTLNMPIPDALTTITEFMNQMELALSQNGTQQNQTPTASSNSPASELPRNSRGYPTVEALNIVLQHAQNLLRDTAVPALSNTTGHLDQVRGSSDPSVREQVQTESMRLGVAMQHLGALLLELGRTILTLRLGQSPDESFVNAGPAVYISPSGPNPIMVQPFPLQSRSLFGALSGVAPSPVAMGTVGVGNVARNVNIHIHTGASLAPLISTAANREHNGEEARGERVNGTDSGESGQARPSSRINITASTVPSRPATVSTSSDVRPGPGVSQTSDPNSISSIIAGITSQLGRMPTNRQNENNAPSEGPVHQDQPVGGSREDEVSFRQRNLSGSGVGETNTNLPNVPIMDEQKGKTEPSTSSLGGPHNAPIMSDHAESHKTLAGSGHSNENPDGSSGVPLGLGLGGLQPKRRSRQATTQDKISGGASSSNQDKTSIAVGQQVLQSLASLSTGGNLNPPSSQEMSDLARGGIESAPAASQNADEPNDVVDAMSQVLRSPSLDGLLAGVSRQTGVGSPDMLRNMFQQFTQNPAMRSTLNQMAQQLDGQNLGNMFSGLDGRGQGGGIDLSGMMQQMMPIVSQALGGMSSLSQQNHPSESVPFENSSRNMLPINDDPQVDLQPVVQRLEDQASPHEIFRSVAAQAMHLFNGGNEEEHILNELCSQGGLAQEFVEMLHLDISRRLHDETGS
ncbi:hypothetical protein C2S52_011472 [Perilla frutescens var. hirtella]|nr:hypothetical protein C2S52_011472 [Perilla frutescens var. hirtella]